MKFLKFYHFTLLVFLLPSSLCLSKTPNFLVIHTGDMGWSVLACYGHPVHQTPNIDQLAAEGIRFTQAYAASMVRPHFFLISMYLAT